MSGAFLLGFCYVSVVIFAVVFVVRAMRLASLPVHLRWELAPVPHEKGKAHYGGSYFEEFEWWTKPREKSLLNEGLYMFKEIFLLKGVWEHNRRLWKFSLPFHLGLYTLIAMAGVLVLGAVLNLVNLGGYAATIATLVNLLGGIGYVLGAIGLAGLLAIRLTSPDYKPFTSPGTVINLFYILVVCLTGCAAIFGTPDFGGEMSRFAGAFFTADFSIGLGALLGVHLVLALVFLLYLPFTRMMHFMAKYFTYHEVRWDDEPMKAGSKREDEVKKLLGQTVGWSAPHLKADGKKTWVDIVTEEVDK